MKNRTYYTLRKLNPNTCNKPYELDKYLYIHDKLKSHDNECNIAYAILFHSKKEAEEYKTTNDNAKDYAIYKVDPREHCLSRTSCDDCSWSGACQRYPY